MTVKLQTISQQRAKKVYDLVSKRKESGMSDEYEKYSAKLPSLITNNGLAATVAFMKEKGNVWGALLEDLENCLNENDLFQTIFSVSSAEYRMLSREALKYAEWFKRISSIIFKS